MSSFPYAPPAAAPRTSSFSLIKSLLALAVLVIAVLVMTVGRNLYRKYNICRSAVVRFHQHMDHVEYEAIYNEATPDFRNAATKDAELGVLRLVHDKMGTFEKMTPLGFHVNANIKGTFANQVYETHFAMGTGQEQFVWRLENNNALLVSYHVDSPNFK